MKNLMVFCSNSVNGGTAQMFYLTASGLRERLPDIQVIPCIDSGNCVEIYKKLSNIVRIPVYSEAEILGELRAAPVYVRVPRRLIRNIRYRRTKEENIETFKIFLEKQNVDAVMIHNGGYMGDDLCNQLLEAAWEVRVQNRIMILHNDFRKNFLRKSLCRGYDKMINRCATQVVTVSEFTRNRMLESSYLDKDMKVIYNGVSFDNQESLDEKKKKVNYMDDVMHIGMVGNFLDNKGQMDFLRAMAQILEDSSEAIQGIMIGNIYDHAYYEQCITFIETHQMEQSVSIAQGVYNAREYYELFDITVVPSLYDESFGLVAVESMRAGIPVVAYNVGGVPEIIRDGKEGYIVPIGDAEALTARLKKLLHDKGLREELGENGKMRYFEKFTVDRMINDYAKLLE